MKKKYFLYSLLAVLMCMCSVKSFAHDIEVKNADGVTIYYSWRNDGTELAVSYFGVDGDEPSIGFYSGEVIIPESVEYGGKTYKVTGIYLCAFLYCGHLTSVTIPNTVTSIGERAFEGCGSLNSITIPSSVTSIDFGAFSSCGSLESIVVENGNTKYDSRNNCKAIIETESNILIAGCKNTIIPNSVTSIGISAFSGCRGLPSVTIPNSVTSIGDGAFRGCSGLISVTIPNSVTSIGNSTFSGCSGLTSVTIPNNVTSIGDFAFAGCSGLTTVTIPNDVTSIGFRAFDGCSDLTSITIPSSVTSIGNYAFAGCKGLISIKVESGNQTYDSRNNCNAIIEKSSNTLIVGCKKTIIPNNVTSLGVAAFDNCSGLTSVTIPNNVISIGHGAFNNCSGLTSVTIPNSVTSIGSWAFEDCSGLTSVTIPNSVTSIGDGAFSGCSGLTSVTIPNSVTSIGGSAFYGTAWYNNQPDGLIYAGKVAYGYKGKMPANTHITIKDGTLGIAGVAFFNCNGLTSVTIPNSVTSIGNQAFYRCTSLTSVTIPHSVTSIGRWAFEGCSSLTTIVSEIEKPFVIDESVFNSYDADIYTSATLIVPKGTKSAYQATEGWNQFTNIVEAGESEPDQPGQIHINDIFYKLTGSGEAEVVSVEKGETNVTIPSTISYNNNTYKVTSIAKEVFENREHLAAVIWEPEAQFNAKVNNPNFLLYVSDEKYASHTVKNVVVNGVAENIELTDAANGNDFYCPKAFKAKSIIYSHNFQMETGLGESKGWETIVLPFDVQKYTHATKGELESFTTWLNGTNKKPFWLFELTASGYKDVAGIKANTPYIISMPNNQQYEQQYQIPGVVTFSASDVEVQKSDNLKPVSYQGRSFVPNYTNQNNADFLALNVSNNYVTNPGKDISGSKFVRGLRAVHPFEAYMTTTDNTRSIDVMDGMTTAIRGIQMVKDVSNTIKVYDARGVLLKTATCMDDAKKGLKVGVYIVNGKKMIIK